MTKIVDVIFLFRDNNQVYLFPLYSLLVVPLYLLIYMFFLLSAFVFCVGVAKVNNLATL